MEKTTTNGVKKQQKKVTKPRQKSTVSIAKKEYEELLKHKEQSEKYLYLYSEFENYKKRIQRDREQSENRQMEKIILSFLPIMDSIELALSHLDEHSNKDGMKEFLDGLNMIKGQFDKVLRSYGVEPIESLGEKFDPNFNEAMDQQNNPEKESGIILKEYQKGYKIKDKLLRPALVSVNASK